MQTEKAQLRPEDRDSIINAYNNGLRDSHEIDKKYFKGHYTNKYNSIFPIAGVIAQLKRKDNKAGIKNTIDDNVKDNKRDKEIDDIIRLYAKDGCTAQEIFDFGKDFFKNENYTIENIDAVIKQKDKKIAKKAESIDDAVEAKTNKILPEDKKDIKYLLGFGIDAITIAETLYKDIYTWPQVAGIMAKMPVNEKPNLPEETIIKIRYDLSEKNGSTYDIAKRYSVSTVAVTAVNRNEKRGLYSEIYVNGKLIGCKDKDLIKEGLKYYCLRRQKKAHEEIIEELNISKERAQYHEDRIDDGTYPQILEQKGLKTKSFQIEVGGQVILIR